MCGFTGFLSLDPRVQIERERLARMTRTLEHRGPDDESLLLGPGWGLGFRRLSIIDLEGGRQPFVRENGNLIVCTNGEIYNYVELRRELESRGHHFESQSDCEIVPALYREFGAGFAERMIGMFAFCIIDTAGDVPEVLLGRDRLGIKPLYYALTDEGLFFASEPKAILAAETRAPELRPEALLDYLVQGYIGGEHAAFAGMQRLAGGHTLRFRAGASQPTVAPYWRMPLAADSKIASANEILELLDTVVADRRIADVPLGAFLSGGIDSSAVVDSMARNADEPVIACSIGFEERSHDELDLAKRTAKRLDLIHHTRVLAADPAPALEVLPWLYDEPHADPSNVPTWLVSKTAREHVTVALSGDGGDETFAGYRRYVHDVAENRVRRTIGSAGRALARSAGRVYPKLDFAPRFLRAKTFLTNAGDDPARAYWRSVTQLTRADALALLAPDVVARLGEHDPFDRFEEHYRRPSGDDSLYRAQYADFHTYLPDQILAKVDRASMGVSLEVRVPLLDHRFIERFATMPPSAKIHGGRGKYALREALRTRLPNEILDGKKRGFDTPLKRWIRGPLSAEIEASIAELPAEWFNRPAIERLASEHRAGVRDHGRALWSLFVLDRWRRRHNVSALSS